MKVSKEPLPSSFDRTTVELPSTASASTFRNLACEFDETGTVEDLLDRIFVMIVERPDPSLAKADIVRKERLFLATTRLLEKFANRTKETSQQLASQTSSSTID
jgi:hypothetical protein